MEHPLSQGRAGVLMHISSLPSRYGVGDCGPEAFKFIDFLKASGQSWWQMLPIGPMGVGFSPYQTFSAFAGSALWVSPEALRKEGWLKPSDLSDYPAYPKRRTDYAAVSREKHRLLGIAFGQFLSGKLPRAYDVFEDENKDWLEDYALFSTLQQLQGRAAWALWPDFLRRREREALEQVRHQLHEKVAFQKFVQFVFFRQWKALKTYAKSQGIGLIGDMPLYMPHDSADVWAHKELFELNAKGMPWSVAGVAPDDLSANGQRWGNPVYNWEAHRQEGYRWWIQRFKGLFQMFDVVRLDHFAGYQRFWEIPFESRSAANGRFRPGPGVDFFNVIQQALPEAAFIAEDLGPADPEVSALRDQFQIPGTRVLQFAFSGDAAQNPHLPNKLTRDTIVYTGTHDSNTTKAWFSVDATEAEILRVREYIGRPSGPAHWQLIRLAYSSQAGTAIIPMQDILGLGPEARMNYPGRQKGNWTWRMAPDLDLNTLAAELRHQTERCGRLAPESLSETPDGNRRVGPRFSFV